MKGFPFILALLAWLVPLAAQTAEVPHAQATVTIAAFGQPLPDFLRTLVGPDVILSIAPSLGGMVNGRFKDTRGAVFDEIKAAFRLVSFYDGETLYILPASQAASRTFDLGETRASAVLARARKAGLTDAQNKLQLRGQALVASGAPQFLQRITDLARNTKPDQIAASDAQAPQDPVEYRVYYLRYAWAEDQHFQSGGKSVVLPGLATTLRALVQTNAHAANAEIMPDRRSKTVRSLTTDPVAARSENPPSPLSIASLAQALSNNSSSPEEPTPQRTADGAVSPAVTEPRVEADGRLNAIVIRDLKSRLDSYDGLIRALDIEPQIVQIEAQIIDVDLNKAKQFGFGLTYRDQAGDTLFNINSASSFETPGSPNITATLKSSGNWTASLQAMEGTGAARVISRPLVLTLSDIEAAFGDSQTFYVRVAGSLNADLFNVTAGTNLRVTPHVFKDGGATRIRLLVAIEDGSLGKQSVDNIPVVSTSELTTQAVVLDGQSLLVGGMVMHSRTNATGKIPVLGDAPVVGGLFRSIDHSEERLIRLFLITPHLASPGQTLPAPDADKTPTADMENLIKRGRP